MLKPGQGLGITRSVTILAKIRSAASARCSVLKSPITFLTWIIKFAVASRFEPVDCHHMCLMCEQNRNVANNSNRVLYSQTLNPAYIPIMHSSSVDLSSDDEDNYPRVPPIQ